MHVVIIGNGIAGVTCARFVRKNSDCKITIISGESEYHFSRPALMYQFMGHMKASDLRPYENRFWKKNKIDLVFDWVDAIDFKSKTVSCYQHSPISYDKLVLAVGSKTSYYNWNGQDLDGVHGMVGLDDLKAMERHAKNGIEHAVIVGGGLIGVEMAECLHSRKIPLTFLVRENSYWGKVLPKEESQMVSKIISDHPNIEVKFNTELSEIWGDQNGKVKLAATKSGEKIKCNFVGITAGVSPNIDWLRFTDLKLDKGILVNNKLETNITDVYAIGDCAQQTQPEPLRRPIEAIWYTAKMMGEVAAHNLLGNNVKYDPGIFFNSAKFFNTEYQIYGNAPAVKSEHQEWFYWKHPKKNKSVRLYWNATTRAFEAVVVMGIRYRHEVCEKWIKDKTSIDEVLSNLQLANFDPEFFENSEKDLVTAFNAQFGTHIQPKAKRSLDMVRKFLGNFKKKKRVF